MPPLTVTIFRLKVGFLQFLAIFYAFFTHCISQSSDPVWVFGLRLVFGFRSG